MELRWRASGAQDKLVTRLARVSGSRHVWSAPKWPGSGRTVILARPDCPVSATATRLPSGLTAAEVTVTCLKTGPNRSLQPATVTRDSWADWITFGAPWSAETVTTQPPPGFVTSTGGASARAARPGSRTGGFAEPTLVMTK